MKEFLEYVKLSHISEGGDFEKATSILEQMYFMYIKNPMVRLSWSDDYQIALDLIFLRSINVPGETVHTDMFKSNLIKMEISPFSSECMDKSICDLISINILHKYRYYITAAFIADVVNRNSQRQFWQWVASLLVTIVAASASLAWLVSKAN